MSTNDKPANLTASDRIKQLNDIDKDVIRLLQSAGLAIKALIFPGSTCEEETSNRSATVEQQKTSFTATTSNYFALVSSLDVRLRRQIYALEEADILPPETSSKDSQTHLSVPLGSSASTCGSIRPSSRPMGSGKAPITGGGLGSLDVGWLNSRNDRVGKEMEAELWDHAQRVVQPFEIESSSSEAAPKSRNEESSTMMQIS